MPAELVAHSAVPGLAEGLSPEMLQVLRRIQEFDFIRNNKALAQSSAHILRRLTELGLVDPAYDGAVQGQPSMWIANGNGSRVLHYLASFRRGPHYEIASPDLAAWLEEQGEDRWWNVDGDPLLNGRMTYPRPAGELAAELRRLNRPLLVQAKEDDATAKGQPVGKEKLNDLASPFFYNPSALPAQPPSRNEDRVFNLCWKDRPSEWLFVEDTETTEMLKADEIASAE